MNILAIDFGLKRIGIAVGTTAAGIAFPRVALVFDHTVVEQLDALVQEEDVEWILVGTPHQHDGAPGSIDHELQDFVKRLHQSCKLPVELVEERFTSKMAQSKLRAVNMKEKDQKSVRDSVAAQIFLQEYLDSFS
jgi:putative holliday junction resolvase